MAPAPISSGGQVQALVSNPLRTPLPISHPPWSIAAQRRGCPQSWSCQSELQQQPSDNSINSKVIQTKLHCCYYTGQLQGTGLGLWIRLEVALLPQPLFASTSRPSTGLLQGLPAWGHLSPPTEQRSRSQLGGEGGAWRSLGLRLHRPGKELYVLASRPPHPHPAPHTATVAPWLLMRPLPPVIHSPLELGGLGGWDQRPIQSQMGD